MEFLVDVGVCSLKNQWGKERREWSGEQVCHLSASLLRTEL
jgi:hypothetical protein